MSPRRRWFLLALLVIPAGIATALLLRSSPGSAGVRVLVVPGYGGDAASVADLTAALRASGRTVRVVELPELGTGDVRRSAAVLDRAAGRGTVDVVGYSTGGVVVRWWLRFLGGAGQARYVVTLGSPHHGTTLAAQLGGLAPQQCTGACAQLQPGSALLRSLNEGDETPDGPAYTAVWAARDETVLPPASAQLAGATNCRADVSHSALARDPAALALAVTALTGAPAC